MKILQEAGRSILSSSSGRVASEPSASLFRDTAGHHISPSAEFEYTFGQNELRSTAQRNVASVLVHHGLCLPIDGYEIVHVHHEGLPLFLSGDAGVSNLSLGDLAAAMAGRITNWKQIGGRDLPIAVGIRGDGVF